MEFLLNSTTVSLIISVIAILVPLKLDLKKRDDTNREMIVQTFASTKQNSKDIEKYRQELIDLQIKNRESHSGIHMKIENTKKEFEDKLDKNRKELTEKIDSNTKDISRLAGKMGE